MTKEFADMLNRMNRSPEEEAADFELQLRSMAKKKGVSVEKILADAEKFASGEPDGYYGPITLEKK